MEILDLYDGRKNKLNKTFVRENGEPNLGEYKQSVHVWITNNSGKFLIEKRGKNMKSNPEKWAFIGGVPESGETSLEGAIREVKEEVGINLDKKEIELLITYKREHDFVDVWIAKKNTKLEDIVLQKSEVEEAKWVDINELEKIIINNEFVPSVNLYFDFLKNILFKSYKNYH